MRLYYPITTHKMDYKDIIQPYLIENLLGLVFVLRSIMNHPDQRIILHYKEDKLIRSL